MKGFPSRFTAGDTFQFDVDETCDAYGNRISSLDGWALTFHLRGNVAGASVDLTSTADGAGGWTFAMSNANSLKFAGLKEMFWTAKATKGSDVRTVASGSSQVLKDLGGVSAVPYDGASQAEKDLLAVQATMRAMVSGGAVAKYSIQGRSVEKMSMTDLLALESKLKVEVSREKQAAASARGERPRNSMFVRFTR